MKDFLSNSWVVSIISGIIVFFLTNAIIMLKDRRKHKKQISDANSMVLNRLRGYVVDNGLPPKEIINSVKASTAREYNIKYEELLSIKELCEELITDIIGNIYISNDNKVKYIDMLKNYLNNLNNIKEDYIKVKNEIRNNRIRVNKYTGTTALLISGTLSFIGTLLTFIITKNEESYKSSDMYYVVLTAFLAVVVFIMFPFIFKIKTIIKWINTK